MEYANLPSIAITTLGLTTALVVLGFLAIVLRILAKTGSKRNLTIDDWWVIAAYVLEVPALGLLFWGEGARGEGNLVNFLKMLMVSSCIYPAIVTCVKLSILCFYRRIFTTPSFRMASTVMLVISVVWFVAVEIASILTCVPIERFWNTPKPGTCLNYNAFFLSYSLIEIVIDLIILIMPLPSIWALQLSQRNKWVVTAIFSLGGFVVIADVLKVGFSYNPHATLVNFDQVELWSFLHATTGIICACLPTYRPLAAKAASATTKLRQRYGSWSKLISSPRETKDSFSNTDSGRGTQGMGDSNESFGDYVHLTNVRAGSDVEVPKPGINVKITFHVNADHQYQYRYK